MKTLRSVLVVTTCCTLPLAAGCSRDGFPAVVEAQAQRQRRKAVTALPNKNGSRKLAVFGDFGTGSRSQMELAGQMRFLHARFKYDFVVFLETISTAPSGPRISRRSS